MGFVAAIPAIAAAAAPLIKKLVSGGKKGVPEDLATELQNWFQNAGQQGGGMESMSAELRNKLLAEIQQRADEGVGTPDYLQGVGEQINPYARQAQTNLTSGQQKIAQQQQGMRKAGDIAGDVQGSLDQYGSGINQTGDAIGSDIAGTFGRTQGRSEGAHQDIVGNIKDTFGGLNAATSGTYGGLAGDTAGTFGKVRGDEGAAYDASGKLIDTIDPSGMAAQARQSRSFEPAMASMALRLRKAGVSPNSPEYNAAMATVESDRARAMDDASIGERDKYISAKSGNILGKAQTLGGLDLSGQQEQTRLGETQAGILRNLGLQQGEDFRGEQVRNLGDQNSQDTARLAAQTANANTTQDRSADYWAKQMNMPLLASQLEQTDLDRTTATADRQNKVDQGIMGVDSQVFNTGNAFHSQDLAYKDEAQNNIGTLAQQEFDNAQKLKSLGLGAIQTAYAQPQSNQPSTGAAVAGAVGAGGQALSNYLATRNNVPGSSTSGTPQSQTTSTGNSSVSWNPGFYQPGPTQFTPPSIQSPQQAQAQQQQQYKQFMAQYMPQSNLAY